MSEKEDNGLCNNPLYKGGSLFLLNFVSFCNDPYSDNDCDPVLIYDGLLPSLVTVLKLLILGVYVALLFFMPGITSVRFCVACL